jgi:hypothetical protein
MGDRRRMRQDKELAMIVAQAAAAIHVYQLPPVSRSWKSPSP